MGKVALQAIRFGCRRIVTAGQGWARIGGYARKLVSALIEAGLNVFVVNPRRIEAFAPPRA